MRALVKSNILGALIFVLISSMLAPLSTARGGELFADRVDLFFDPDSPLPAGQTLLDFYQTKKYVYVYREIIPTEVGGHTYFAILGSNGGYPDFYGGIQHFADGSKAAIFSAWDVGADGSCGSCLPGTGAPEKQVSVWAKGPRTVTRPFGYEGTGMNSMIYGFDWKIGQKVGMLASIEPSGAGSLISAAIKNGNAPWEFMTSFYVPTRYDMGMPGNYSFLEDWVGEQNITRSYLVGPSYLEDANGKGNYFSNVYAYSSNISGNKIPNKSSISVEGSWLKVRSGITIQDSYKVEQRFQLSKPNDPPEIADGKVLLEEAVFGKSTRAIENQQTLATLYKILAEAKAAAELKAKQEAEAKAAADKVVAEKVIADAKLEAARILAEAKAKASAALEKTTITCVKGKLTKKVTAVKPKCPSGYKLKK